MTVEAKFNNTELAGKLRDGPYELPETATVATLLETAQREANHELTQQQKNSLVFIYNNAHATYDTELQHGGKLRILHLILGG